jgi:hypothetical protein
LSNYCDKKELHFKFNLAKKTNFRMGGGASTMTKLSSVLAISKDGVKLSYVKEFYDSCGGKEMLKDLTTTEVNDKFLKPMTASSQLSLCEYLKESNHPAVGVATVFISHAWLYKFLDVVDALQYHFRDTPDIVIWFDLTFSGRTRF